MKESIKFLNRISKIKGLEPENYYSISIWANHIVLQAKFNSKLAKRLKFVSDPKISDHGYIEFKRGRLEIILT